jgi:hypothetical protein
MARADEAKQELDLRATAQALLANGCTPDLLLRLAGHVWPDQLVILDSALRSARDSADFRNPKKVGLLLSKLATEYFDTLAGGQGDNQAKNVFGAAYGAKESSKLSTEGIRRRTFWYRGQPVVMESHLKIGNAESDCETLRIHFWWDAHTKRIVIGHCGPHLPL